MKGWEEIITSTNMIYNSRKTWKTIKLPNHINDRGNIPHNPRRPAPPSATKVDYSRIYPFSEEECSK